MYITYIFIHTFVCTYLKRFELNKVKKTNRCDHTAEVGIYKRNQESKKKRKKTRSRSRKRPRKKIPINVKKKKEHTLSTKKKVIFEKKERKHAKGQKK